MTAAIVYSYMAPRHQVPAFHIRHHTLVITLLRRLPSLYV
jgi:hypothetical protein